MSSCRIFFNDTATTEIYTLSLHDALPISAPCLPNTHCPRALWEGALIAVVLTMGQLRNYISKRSEEHTSELQSRQYLVCRLLLEKKNKHTLPSTPTILTISHSIAIPPHLT